MKTILTILFVAVLAATGGWWWGAHHGAAGAASAGGSREKKILFYQSPMHPWVKSDKPGNCTVCGMELVPVYEGGQSHDGATTDIVMLPEGSPNITSVRTAEVKRQPLTRTMRVAGMIDDDDSRHRILSAYAGGRIEKLFVNFEGAEVQAGQPLATFYSKELLNAANEYKVVASQANASLLSSAESRLLQMGLTPEQIAKIPKRADNEIFFEIVAPLTGTVVKRHVYEGQYVQEGEKLFEIADFSKMWFQFIAYEQDLPFLKVGQEVTVRTAALPDKVFKAAVKFINPNMDDMTRSARVRVEIDNPNRELRHKLYAEATVALEAPEVVAVPRSAILWPGSNPRVYVEQSKGAYQQRRVILGRAGDNSWEVLEGVKAGERVVASGNMLIDGQAQLNNLAAPADETITAHDPAMEMTATEHDAMEKYLSAVAALTATLASDDLKAFNHALTKLPQPPKGLSATAPAPAADLPAARKGFLPLSEAVAEYARQVRGHLPALKIFRCPMTDQAGEGMPKNAKWIQLTAELRNPFFGHEMIDCGAEVK
ncbi:MAG: efflux RND transporter periplasmic adaptor subunit [Verrucomicrobiota bacterium]|nr:efflux RND transporter periplasmic adaptor subunit [Verrucomicrobiota bacterium]